MRVTRFTALCSVLLARTARAVANNIVAPTNLAVLINNGIASVSFNPSTNAQLGLPLLYTVNVQLVDDQSFQPYGPVTVYPIDLGSVTATFDLLGLLQSLPYNLSEPVYAQFTAIVTQLHVPSNTLTSIPFLARFSFGEGQSADFFTSTTSYPVSGPTGTVTLAQTATINGENMSWLYGVRTATTEETISGSVVTETFDSTYTGLTQTITQAGPTTTSTNAGCWQYSLTFASGCCPTSVLTPSKGPPSPTPTAHRHQLALDSAQPTALAKQRRTLFEPTVATVTNQSPTSTSVCRAVHVPDFTCPRSPFFGFLAQQFLNFYKARAPANFPILSVQCDGSSTLYTY